MLIPRGIQGEILPASGISKPYCLKIAPGHERDPWKTNIIMSTLPRNQLPGSLNQEGVQVLCEVESNLRDSAVERKLKNRHWWNYREKYLRVQFDVNVIIGAADLQFQLQSRDKRVLSVGHSAIRVDWEAPETPTSNGKSEIAAFYEGLR